MVSGLVTSPCDQLRIFSGEASMMRMASKSVIGLVSSNGFERNKATLLGRLVGPRRGFSRDCLRILPAREAAIAALKKDPEKQWSEISGQFSVRLRCLSIPVFAMRSFADR